MIIVKEINDHLDQLCQDIGHSKAFGLLKYVLKDLCGRYGSDKNIKYGQQVNSMGKDTCLQT